MIPKPNPYRLNDLSWSAASVIGIIVMDEFTWSAAFGDGHTSYVVYDAEMPAEDVLEH